MHELELEGCQLQPLSSYLKALGVLRVLHRVDPDARAGWRGGRFVLRTVLGRDEVMRYLTDDYEPSPILAAWNGGGGLFMRPRKDPKTKQVLAYDKPTANSRATDALSESTAGRLAPVRRFIEVARRGTERLGLHTSPDTKTDKPVLLQWLRDHVDDDVLPWLDAAFVMEDATTPRYFPVLGTGGNDGALDFGNKFQGYIADVMELDSGCATTASAGWLRAALFGAPSPGLTTGTPGQFDAGRAGGANGGQGFDGQSLVNPWDFLLFMEGSLVFAGSATKRLEHQGPGMMSFPFTVRSTAAGNGAMTLSDEGASATRHEVWLPVWEGLASLDEVERVFREGRATVGRRPAKDGADFARALAGLGVDRGIQSFVRYGFLQRNGLAYVATPLGQWRARHVPALDLIDRRQDRWFDKLRQLGQTDHAPASIRRAYRRVNEAVMGLAAESGAGGGGAAPARVQDLLVAISEVDQVVSRSTSMRSSLWPSPVPGADERTVEGRAHAQQAWVDAADDGSVELRLAVALAAAGSRRRIVPIDEHGRWRESTTGELTWVGRDLVDDLIRWVRRAEVERRSTAVPWGGGASVDDVMAFLEGRVNPAKLSRLVVALSPFAMARVRREPRGPASAPVDVLWALAALAWDQCRADDDHVPRWTPGMVAAGAKGDGVRMSSSAVRRLRPGVLRHRRADAPPLGALAMGALVVPRERTLRCTAALAFPLEGRALERLTKHLYRASEPSNPTNPSSRS
jgi:CRISPR-associated protein Csx17